MIVAESVLTSIVCIITAAAGTMVAGFGYVVNYAERIGRIADKLRAAGAAKVTAATVSVCITIIATASVAVMSAGIPAITAAAAPVVTAMARASEQQTEQTVATAIVITIITH